MKTLGNVKGSGFGFAVVAAGQRNMTADPQVIATSTEGGFRITGPVTRILGIQHGDYVMFINNVANIDQAIANKVEELVAFVDFKTSGLGWSYHDSYVEGYPHGLVRGQEYLNFLSTSTKWNSSLQVISQQQQ